MKSAARKAFLSMLLPLALAGCGKGRSEEDSFSNTIATAIEADCLRITSTSSGAEKRRQLCTCTGQRIRASGMKAEDGDPRNNEKIHAAQQACRQQVHDDGA